MNRVRLLLAVAVMLPACRAGRAWEADGWAAAARSRLAREWDRAADAPPEVRARLAGNPIAFFRFVNRAWTHAVCDAFAGEASDLPTARLHGDAHLEQYAVTATARGLDDFDDSARGPAVVDVVRFLGSLELAAEQRGWTAALPLAVDAFIAGVSARPRGSRRICLRIPPWCGGCAPSPSSPTRNSCRGPNRSCGR